MVKQCGELLHSVYSPAVFPTLKRRDKTPRISRGKTLSIDSMDLAVGESELYSDLMTAPLDKEIENSRESHKRSLL
jgi:hypothetical protein